MQRLDAAEGQVDREIVHAKFVLGADGASFRQIVQKLEFMVA